MVWLGIHDSSEMLLKNVAENKFGVESVILHEKYDGVYNDIAIVKLDQEINFSEIILPICLPSTKQFPDGEGRVSLIN